jgi:hypothetical protein
MTRIYSAAEVAAAAQLLGEYDGGGVSLQGLCATDWVAYKHALDGLIDRDPALLLGDASWRPLVAKLNEKVVNLFADGWFVGLCIATAHQEGQGLIVPKSVCRRCDGGGRLWNDSCFRRFETVESACSACGGSGLVGIAGKG